jgi:hypothetical protein
MSVAYDQLLEKQKIKQKKSSVSLEQKRGSVKGLSVKKE